MVLLVNIKTKKEKKTIFTGEKLKFISQLTKLYSKLLNIRRLQQNLLSNITQQYKYLLSDFIESFSSTWFINLLDDTINSNDQRVFFSFCIYFNQLIRALPLFSRLMEFWQFAFIIKLNWCINRLISEIFARFCDLTWVNFVTYLSLFFSCRIGNSRRGFS